MAKPPHTRAAMRAFYPVCQVAELAAGYGYTTLSGGLWLPRAFRRPAFASCAFLRPLWSSPALTIGLLECPDHSGVTTFRIGKTRRGELASLRRERGTLSAGPLRPADRCSIKDVSTPFVPFCITTLQSRLHGGSTRSRLFLA